MEVIFNIQPMPAWDWRVAADLFFGGMGVGTFLFSVVADWHFKGKYKALCRTAAQLSPALVIVGLLFLLSEMGRPYSFYLLFLSYSPDSVIWWGGWLQTIFVIGALIYAKWWSEEDRAYDRRILGWALSPFALGVGAYHGLLLSSLEVRALWSTGSTVLASMLSLITTGIAVTLIVHLWKSRNLGRLAGDDLQPFLDEMHEVRNLLGAALFAQAFIFLIWYIALKQGDAADQMAMAAANATYAALFWGLGIGLGLILPLMMGVYFILFRVQVGATAEVNSIVLTSGLILVGGFVIRLGIVLGGQAAPLIMSLG